MTTKEFFINKKVLESCDSHDFNIDSVYEAKNLNHKFVCKNCGGFADASAVHWYNLGRLHLASCLKKGHNLDGYKCWCNPTTIKTSGSDVIVHNEV